MPFTLKKTTFLAFSSMLVFAFSSSSFADSCDSLLNAGIYNVTQSSSATDSQWMAKSTFCSADYSNTSNSRSTQASIEGSYAGFGAGASGSASASEIITTQKNVCTLGFDSGAYRNRASDYAKTVYQGSLDAWNTCQALANKGVIFESQTDIGLQGVTVTLSAPAGASSQFLGMSQRGTGRFLCRTTLPARGTSLAGKVIVIDASTALTFDSASKLIINCQRQMRLDAAGNLNADAQTLVFNTRAGAYQVPMAAIGSYSRTSVDKVMAQVKTDYQNADAQLSNQISANRTICAHAHITSATVNCGPVAANPTLTSEYTILGGGCASSSASRYVVTSSLSANNGWTCITNEAGACQSGYADAWVFGCIVH